MLGVPLTFEYYSLAAGASVNFTVDQPRYLLVWLCESSGRGAMKLSFVLITGETTLGTTSSTLTEKFALSLDRTNNLLKLTNNDSVSIGGKIVVLGNY